MEQQREKELDSALQNPSVEEEDSKFFEYAEEVLQLAKKRGRSTIPIERVIAVRENWWKFDLQKIRGLFLEIYEGNEFSIRKTSTGK